MTANNLERAMLIEAVDKEREGRRASLLPFPSRTMMARPSTDRQEKLRILEALLFAAPEPLDQAELARHFAEGEDIASLLTELQTLYAERGVNLVRVAGKWAFRTAADLAFLLEREAVEQRRLSRAALETLSDHRLSPAGHPRRDRGDQRRQHLERHPRRAARNRLDQAQGQAARAGAPGDLRHHRAVPRPFRLRLHPGPAGPLRAERGRAPRLQLCLLASPCPIPTTLRSCAKTRIRSKTSLARTTSPAESDEGEPPR